MESYVKLPVERPYDGCTMWIKIHFGGGLEMLFDKKKKWHVQLPPLPEYFPQTTHKNWTMLDLLQWMKDNMVKERPELFLQGNTVRPGILVLINDADWELHKELSYKIEDNDVISFISTLHGG